MLADADDGLTKIDTTFDGDTVWLSIDQMAELFQRDRSVIGKHVRNIFKEGELQKESVWAKFAYTAADGKVYDVDYYNLSLIHISEPTRRTPISYAVFCLKKKKTSKKKKN